MKNSAAAAAAGPGTASADVMLGRSVDNLFDANDTALPPQTGNQTVSLDSLVTGLGTTLTCSPPVAVRDAVALLSRPRSYVDKSDADARQVAIRSVRYTQTRRPLAANLRRPKRGRVESSRRRSGGVN